MSTRISDIRIINLSMPTANTEYELEIPDDSWMLRIQTRGGEDLRVSFQPGVVATGANPHWTHKGTPGVPLAFDRLTGYRKLYLACATGSVVVEALIGN